MADLRVFVSSTCYDLAVVREQLRVFLQNMGYSPVMSDYSDVLYDPRNHTHTSCVVEVLNCDLAVVVIGGRFGGTGVPEAVAQVDFDAVKGESTSRWIIEHRENVSITQLEVLRAIEASIPVFAFIDEQVWHDHLVYEKNKKTANSIHFPSIDRPETAVYVFEFINFLRHRTRNNAIQKFSRVEDITSHLRKQWSGLFQRLLLEVKRQSDESRSVAQISEQLESLKTAVLSSIAAPAARDLARNVVRFRKLVDFLVSLRLDVNATILRGTEPFPAVLAQALIVKGLEVSRQKMFPAKFYFLKSDGTLLLLRHPRSGLRYLPDLWTDFAKLSLEARSAIYEAWADVSHSGPAMVMPSRRSIEEVTADVDVREFTLDEIFSQLPEAD